MADTYRKIVLFGHGLADQAKATAAAIRPGDLIERTSGDLVQKQSTAAVPAEMTVAVEDHLQGKGIADNYAASAIVQYEHLTSGQRFLGWLKDGENAGIGDKLVPDGNGGWTVAAGDGSEDAAIRVIAREAKDLSAAGADAQIKMQVL